METQSTHIIPVEDILIKHPEKKLDSLNEITSHIKQREEYFLATLAGVAFNADHGNGWQKIDHRKRYVRKQKAKATDTEALFTGADICDFAAFAFVDAMKQKTTNQTISVVSLQANFNMDSTRARIDDVTDAHFLIEITDNENGETRYFDPTYAQVDHRESRKIAVFTKEELAKKYTKTKEPLHFERTSNEEMDDIKHNLAEFGFKESDYEALIQSLL